MKESIGILYHYGPGVRGKTAERPVRSTQITLVLLSGLRQNIISGVSLQNSFQNVSTSNYLYGPGNLKLMKDVIFFPINENKHFSLAIVCNPGKAVDKLKETGPDGREKVNIFICSRLLADSSMAFLSLQMSFKVIFQFHMNPTSSRSVGEFKKMRETEK